jgi:hypothetical protein
MDNIYHILVNADAERIIKKGNPFQMEDEVNGDICAVSNASSPDGRKNRGQLLDLLRH